SAARGRGGRRASLRPAATGADAEPEAAPGAAVRRPRGPAARQAPLAAAPTSWEPVADWYDELLDERRSDHYRDVVLPGGLRLRGAMAGRRVLDIACGRGALCRELARLGAEVLGVDASPRLLELARRRGRDLGARAPAYALADARELARLSAAPFDAA